ncbi:MAG: GNAT family N-acetyltransferase [Fimbriimonadaceae bacterium]|nr:GNAT family N-acetyltransferase [Fimbriimonadaceae bacterium]
MPPHAPNPLAVRLRPVQDEDLPVFFDQQRDPEAVWMVAFTAKDPSDRGAFDAHWAKIRADDANHNRTIVVGETVVGSAASYVMFGERQVCYGIGREFWGRGYATQALVALLAEVTERPLFARVVADNAGSIRVLEKCGFRVIGHERGFAEGRGEEVDEVVFRLD